MPEFTHTLPHPPPSRVRYFSISRNIERNSFVQLGDISTTTVKGQLLATKIDNEKRVRFGAVVDTKELQFAGDHIHVKNQDIVEGDWVAKVDELNLVKEELETRQNIKAPTSSNAVPSKHLPYTKLKAFKKINIKTWVCPFPNCKEFKNHQTRPAHTRLHIA